MDSPTDGPDEAMDLARGIARAISAAALSCAVAESVTGGHVAAHMAASPHASEWFRGGVVAYSSEVKVDEQVVKRATLQALRDLHEAAAQFAAVSSR